MTPEKHHAEALRWLAIAEAAYPEIENRGSFPVRVAAALAQVHATLATYRPAPAATVAGERTTTHDDLRRHLLTRHHNLAALDLSDADALDDHAYEHQGPGTIRNHDPADLTYDHDQAEG